ncbi:MULTISPECIES: hypothetical protein [Catenuloplanes]|uniref:Uncharacterized protein n=1 Tax=Catenuloplanes niger TaxID=587534 RepID=A0AAE3ZT31_9ACTN|nr:hypothetical protein [Catenuloplanes niger]MDR7323370.1 hypothetical protein [Catenuloplanes niger]
MRVLVDVGLQHGAEIDPTYLLIGHPVNGRIGTGRIGTVDVLADYSNRLMSLSVERTSTRRTGPIVEYNAGTCSVQLLNDDGLLDPFTIEQAGLTAPGVVLRIRLEHDGVTYPIWRGFVDTWIPSHDAPDHATVTITGTDGLGRLAGVPRLAAAVPVGEGDLSGARIHRILDTAGWPAEARKIAAGDTALRATDLAGNPLDEAQDVATAEIGELYVDAQGDIVFRSRHALLTDPRSSTSWATFGSNTAAGEIPYVGRPGISYDRMQMVNRVTVTRDGEDAALPVVEDAASIGRHGLHAIEETLPVTTDEAALGWARWILWQESEPEFRFTSLAIDARIDPDTVLPHAAGREIGDRITVVRRPPGGIVDQRDCFIRSISHTWSPPDRWQTTWGLQGADRYRFFVIGHPSQGVIGANVIAY